MSKVIKLKQSDIEKIVTNIIKEAEFDDFDTQISPEELPGANDPDMEDIMNDDEETTQPSGGNGDVTVALGKDGKYYIINTSNGEILGVK
jgi:hypothetical protein